jgi:tetratricopeptide (TPR) repeat protein
MKRVLSIIVCVNTLLILPPPGAFGFSFEDLMKDLGVLQRTDKEHFERGLKFGKERSWHREMDSYKEAIRINPDYAEAHGQLGYTYRQLERYDDAIASFKEEIRIKPNDAGAQLILAKLYKNTKDDENAIFYMAKAYELAVKLQLLKKGKKLT